MVSKLLLFFGMNRKFFALFSCRKHSDGKLKIAHVSHFWTWTILSLFLTPSYFDFQKQQKARLEKVCFLLSKVVKILKKKVKVRGWFRG